jgi:predicted regulator of Ras-like GTPase activity (Roadblock/LC7/MglB family)
VSDDVRRLSDELARDPSSLVFLQLGETLRRQGQHDLALRVSLRGLERHPHNAEAHDLLARVSADRGDLDRAFDEWDMVLRLSPGHAGARKGLGFVRFRQGRLEEAERYLAEAAAADTEDPSISAALAFVRDTLHGTGDGVSAQRNGEAGDEKQPDESRHEDEARDEGQARGAPPETESVLAEATSRHQNAAPETSVPQAGDAAGAQRSLAMHGAEQARTLFADLIGDAEQTALLLDAQGLVLAGLYVDASGYDVSQEVGAALSGVSDEARRAMRHLSMGEWSSIVFETEAAIVAMAPAPGDALLLVAASRETPLGLVRRLADRAAERARAWLRGGA